MRGVYVVLCGRISSDQEVCVCVAGWAGRGQELVVSV